MPFCRCTGSSTERLGRSSCWVPAHPLWPRPPCGECGCHAQRPTCRRSKSTATAAQPVHHTVTVRAVLCCDDPQALTPLTIGRGRAAASALGALWGFGHSTGQLILGLVFVLLKVRRHGRGFELPLSLGADSAHKLVLHQTLPHSSHTVSHCRQFALGLIVLRGF